MGSKEDLEKLGLVSVQERREIPTAKETEKQVEDVAQSIRQMREKLEIRKLEIELKKLEEPSTNVDYFDKMLQIQQKNFEQLLAMQKEQSSLQLEIEKLKLGNGEGDDNFMGIIEMLAPYLMKNHVQAEQSALEEGKGAVSSTHPPPPIQSNNMESPQLTAYKKLIKEGKVSEARAWKDLQLYAPEEAKKQGREKFHEEFLKLKNGIQETK